VYARLDPGAIATDALGNIFIADTENECIRKIDATGIITKFAGRGRTYGDGGLATSAQVHTPTAVATNAKGSVFIAEYDNHRIRVVSPATTTSARSSNNNDINAEIYSSPVTFSIYPNPAQATLNIQTSNAQGLSKVEVIDAAGRVHISQTVGLASPVIQLQIQRLTPGLYFVRTTDKQNNTNTKEFLKQ
jgi:hypothetical protein